MAPPTTEAAQVTGAVPASDMFTGDEGSPEYWQWKSKMTGMCLMKWSTQSAAQKAGLIAERVGGSASNILWGDLTGEEETSPYPTPASVFEKLTTTYGKRASTNDAVISDLARIKQDSKRAQKYTEEFMAVATKGRLSDETLRGLYLGNLAKRVRVLLLGREFKTLGSLIEAAHMADDLVDKPQARPDNSRPVGRGRGGWRGRGRGRGGYGARGADHHDAQGASAGSNGDQPWHTCYTCNKPGHRSMNCPQGNGGGSKASTQGKAREANSSQGGDQEGPPMYDSRAGAKRARTYTPSTSDYDIGD
jgi:hypothetical protein